jgi:pimeloyl-ACP methyl ester carboxylesterase
MRMPHIMPRWNARFLAGALLLLLAASAGAQEHAVWRDPSPHQVQFVTVDADVRLEVLDWGGSGRPIVLLTGLGNTAHVFDDFAPKLTSRGHVYAVTRRGYGASSIPGSGYGPDRLGDDVLAVLDSLEIANPILVGHSIAGEELSSIGSRHPERVAGLVYLDALFSYAYTTPQEVSLRTALVKLQNDLQAMTSRPLNPLGIPQPTESLPNLLQTLSDVQQQLTAMQIPSSPPPAPPTPDDLASYGAFASWFARVRGFQMPEAEFHQQRPMTPDGRLGLPRTPGIVAVAIQNLVQPFTDIRVPALALCAMAQPSQAATPAAALREARASAFENNIAHARVVRVPGANHYIFISNEAEVLREFDAFAGTLR